jgi:hypothetical protein
MAISAFARAGLAFADERYVARARSAAGFVLGHLRGADGRLRRSIVRGRLGPPAYLDDYAQLVSALVDLHEATGEAEWLEQALALQDVLDAWYGDDAAGGYFTAAADAEPLLFRRKPDYDGAEPSGNSVAALGLLRLEHLTGISALGERADRILAGAARPLRERPDALPALLAAVDFRSDVPLQIFVIVPTGAEPPPELLDPLRRAYLPNRSLLIADDARVPELARLVPAIEGKRALRGQATAFVCERGTCQQPTADPDLLARQLRRRTGRGAGTSNPG